MTGLFYLSLILLYSQFLFRVFLSLKFGNQMTIANDRNAGGLLRYGSYGVYLVLFIFFGGVIIDLIGLFILIPIIFALILFMKVGNSIGALDIDYIFFPVPLIKWKDKKNIIAQIDFWVIAAAFLIMACLAVIYYFQ